MYAQHSLVANKVMFMVMLCVCGGGGEGGTEQLLTD